VANLRQNRNGLNQTIYQYDQVIAPCRELFRKKTRDYGTAWRILRVSSLTDQVFIKAQRIRTLDKVSESKVEEGAESEFAGIFNYCIIALVQLELGEEGELELGEDRALELYDRQVRLTRELMMRKNHDYGEAWRDMRISSFTDLILMKLLRIKQIEDNKGVTLVSEGIESGYRDMANYAAFALIKFSEKQGE
jgi:hypothetical protein